MLIPDLAKAHTTHMGVLSKVILTSVGDVVELGAGLYSTPLLHWICKEMHRKLISYETNANYYGYAKQFRSYFHAVEIVTNWDKIDVSSRRGVVFVDHHPMSRRGVEAIRFKDSADYVVMHDTEKDKYYSEVWQHFKYTYTWKKCRPWTSVVSNFKDLPHLNINWLSYKSALGAG